MKLLAIGGGIYYLDGTWTCTFIDILKRLIELSNNNSPKILIMSHAAKSYEDELIDCAILENIFSNLGCHHKILLSSQLNQISRCEDYLKWSDIIFENGGNTINMINYWNNTGFSELLLKNQDKIFSGISAGANCWFSYFNSHQQNGYISGNGIGLIDAYFVPHAEEEMRVISSNEYLKSHQTTGIYIPTDIGLEIIDNNYRIIRCQNSFGYKVSYKYYQNNQMISKELNNTNKYKNLTKILKK